MVEVEGKIVKQSVFILIDFGSNFSYVAPQIFYYRALQMRKHNKSWLRQLITGTKIKVSDLVEESPLEINGLIMLEALNIFPLGSYDVLISME